MTEPALAGAQTVIAQVADPGSFEPWDREIVSGDPLNFVDSRPYRDRLADAASRSGAAESVITGTVRIEQRPLALVVGEFGFLGGSIGIAAGERLARAFDRARTLRLPLLAVIASGGTRMQEGTLAFLQMVKVSDAVRQFRDAGLLYVVHLSNPTTGGVLASWGSLGALTFGEPGAFLGFSGPRVIELLTGARLPDGVQTAENLLAHGLIDDVLSLSELRRRVGDLLAVVAEPSDAVASIAATSEEAGKSRRSTDAWDSVRRSRDPARAGAAELMTACVSTFTPIGPAPVPLDEMRCIVGLCRVAGVSAVLVAQNRRAPGGARMGPVDLRLAERGFALADELGLPLVTVIDTVGATLSVDAEEGGLAREIAHCIIGMLSVRAPTLCVLLGQGSGGAALALFPSDRVIAAENAWLSAIAPEGASAILYRDTEHAATLADAQRIVSSRLMDLGIVDMVVSEEESDGPWIGRLATALGRELRLLCSMPAPERDAARRRRYRFVGNLQAGLHVPDEG